MTDEQNQIECTVKLERIVTTRTGDNGVWGIIALNLIEEKRGNVKLNKYNNITAVGMIGNLKHNIEYTLIGVEKYNEQYGYQYEIVFLGKLFDFTNEEDVRIFLNMVLTETQTNLLCDYYPENACEILKNGDIDSLLKVPGIGPKTANRLIEKFKESEHFSYAYITLSKFGISQNMIHRLVDTYKSPEIVLEKIKENPYILIKDIDGVGWKKADEIAMNMGLSYNSEYRIMAFMYYMLQVKAEEGNSWVNPFEIIFEIEKNLGNIPRDLIAQCFIKMIEAGELWHNEEKTMVALKKVFLLEKAIAKELLRINSAESNVTLANKKLLYEKIRAQEEGQGWEYTEEQKQAICSVLENNVNVITGKAGCVDCDTEFFNGQQWKKISEYENGDKVLQYNLDGTANLVLPKRYIKQPEETLTFFTNSQGSINQCLSNEHSFVYVTSKGNINKKPFKEVKEHHLKSKNGFYGKIISAFSYSGTGLNLSENEIRLRIAMLADGYYPKRVNIHSCIVRLKKQRKVERLRLLLNRGNYDYTESYTPSDQYTTFRFKTSFNEKEFENYWYNASKKELAVICDEVIYWDGSYEGTKKNRMSVSTCSKKTADFLQFAFSACGKRATISINDRRGQKRGAYIRKSIEYTVIISGGGNLIQTQRKKGNPKLTMTEYKTKDGYKYCFEVDSSMLVLRRNNRIFITGNSGKSSIVAGILKILHDFSFAQTALAGRAADRLREVTNVDGYTIHRLLEFNPRDMSFARNRENPLDQSIIILDETSMVGGVLFYNLLCAIPDGSKLIMLGDVGQLPAIGMLNIFNDIINSGTINCNILSKIHRQAAQSAIITESLNVDAGKCIVNKTEYGVQVRGEKRDLVLDTFDDSIYTIERTFFHFMEEYKKINWINEIQVILPMKRGVELMNKRIQDAINPIINQQIPTVNVKNNGTEYNLRINDKVIIRRNNYREAYTIDKETLIEKPMAVFNGNMGQIIAIDLQNDIITIDLFGIGEVCMPKSTWNSIELGYAITCHSFQGSDAKIIIVGVDSSATYMLSREWLYTAITRAREKCFVVGTTSTIRYCCSVTRVPNKQTFLKHLLAGGIE